MHLERDVYRYPRTHEPKWKYVYRNVDCVRDNIDFVTTCSDE